MEFDSRKLNEDIEHLEEKIILDALMVKVSSEEVKSNVVLLAKVKTALGILTR